MHSLVKQAELLDIMKRYPFKVTWKGFSSDTYILQQYGWKFDYDISTSTYNNEVMFGRIKITNEQENIYNAMYMFQVDMFSIRYGGFIDSLFNTLTICLDDIERQRLLYQKELIIDPSDVSKALKLILEAQKDKQKDIRKRISSNNSIPKLEARILSIA